ncbi:MAG TPA: hypothetical protein VIV12_13540, partial [Streptosporangiaceae bacterium]
MATTMSSTRVKISSAESDDPAILVAVDRATAELRRGGPVVLHDRTARVWLVVAAETVEDEGLARLQAMGEGDPHLVLTAERAAALGLGQRAADVVSLLLPARLPADALWHLADPTAPQLASAPAGLTRSEVPVDIAIAVVELAKLARLLPAAIVAPLRLQS